MTVILVISAVLCGWVMLSLVGGERQRRLHEILAQAVEEAEALGAHGAKKPARATPTIHSVTHSSGKPAAGADKGGKPTEKGGAKSGTGGDKEGKGAKGAKGDADGKGGPAAKAGGKKGSH